MQESVDETKDHAKAAADSRSSSAAFIEWKTELRVPLASVEDAQRLAEDRLLVKTLFNYVNAFVDKTLTRIANDYADMVFTNELMSKTFLTGTE
jgi:hypothetical protein